MYPEKMRVPPSSQKFSPKIHYMTSLFYTLDNAYLHLHFKTFYHICSLCESQNVKWHLLIKMFLTFKEIVRKNEKIYPYRIQKKNLTLSR